MGSFTKFLQLILAVACLGLHQKTMTQEFHPNMNILITGTFFGYTIICAVLLIGELFQKPADKFVNTVFGVVGCILFIFAGFCILKDWEGGFNQAFKTEMYKEANAKGALSIINGLLLLLGAWC